MYSVWCSLQRAVIEKLSRWRIAEGDLVFDETPQIRGGSADLAKATTSNFKYIGTDDRNLGIAQTVAVKKFRFDDDINKNALIAVGPSS